MKNGCALFVLIIEEPVRVFFDYLEWRKNEILSKITIAKIGFANFFEYRLVNANWWRNYDGQ